MSVDIRGGRWLQFLMVAVGLLTYRASAFRKYDEDLALVAMAYSHAAYAVIPYPSDFTLIGNVTREYVPRGYGSTNTILGLVGFSSNLNSLIIGFRGTEDFNQLVSELAHALLYDGPYSIEWTNAFSDQAKAMSYFYEAYLLIKSEIKDLVKRAASMYPGTDILFTGHSLGGALAALSLINVHLYQPKIIKQAANVNIYTFGCSFFPIPEPGQPRLGNKDLALGVDKIFNSTAYYRLINNEDIVPHLPPTNIQSYLHSGIEVWYPSALYKKKVMCGKHICIVCALRNVTDIFGQGGKIQEDSNCSNSLLFHDSISDHLHYWDALENGFCGNATTLTTSENLYARYLVAYFGLSS